MSAVTEIGELLAEQLDVIDPPERVAGLVFDMPEADYHGDRDSLSSTGARRILPPGSPAAFRWEQDHGRLDTRAFDMGHGAHQRVLGVGPEIVGVDAKDWRTSAAKDAAKDARARGAVPLLAEQVERIDAMALALRKHPTAAMLLDPDSGAAEVSAFWQDGRSGAWLRARFDWLRHDREPLYLVDYKSTDCADPDAFARSAARFGYPQQAAHYTDGARALNLADEVRFIFVCQEKAEPYLVSCVELSSSDLAAGRRRNRRAIDLFAQCKAEDDWPAYSDDVVQVQMPAWYSRTDEEWAS